MAAAITIIVNPAAGRGRARRLMPALSAALADSDLDVEIKVSSHADEPAAFARAAFASGRRVVACGGDGLVGVLAQIANESGGTLGIIPGGAGNDFARTVGVDPRRPLQAIEVLRAGRVAQVDLGRVNGRLFCAVAGTGIDAEANRWANGIHWLGGTPLYVAATMRSLAVYRPRRFRITVDGTAMEREAWLVVVANGPAYGGGMRVAPEAVVTDGKLDLVIIGAISRLDFLRTFPKVFSGRHVLHPAVETMRADGVEIACIDGRTMPEIYADGERVGALPATVDILPRALNLIVPDPQALDPRSTA